MKHLHNHSFVINPVFQHWCSQKMRGPKGFKEKSMVRKCKWRATNEVEENTSSGHIFFDCKLKCVTMGQVSALILLIMKPEIIFSIVKRRLHQCPKS